jgi:serine/threonine protein kinase
VNALTAERRKPPRNTDRTVFHFLQSADEEPVDVVAEDASIVSARFALADKPLVEKYIHRTAAIEFGRVRSTCGGFRIPPELERGNSFVVTYSTRQHSSGDIKEGGLALYEIEGFLGAGQSAETYLARVKEVKQGDSLHVDDLVVIKLPLFVPYLSRDEINTMTSKLERLFRREEANLRRVRDMECVAAFLDTGSHRFPLEGTAESMFIVQRHVEGKPLRDFLQTSADVAEDGMFKGLKPANFHSVARRLANGLAELHSSRVVHGDIWPENIMVRTNGSVALIDFGQAVFREAAQTVARVSDRNLRYVAPEQFASVNGDVHSLGGVLFYLATGDDPPELTDEERGDLPALAHRLRLAIAARNPALHREVRGLPDVLARCLCESQLRFTGAEPVIWRLHRFFAHPAAAGGAVASAAGAASAVLTAATDLDETRHLLFQRLAVGRLDELREELASATNGVWDVVGRPRVIAEWMTRCLTYLGRGDEYLTLSTPRFWTHPNPGTDGEFLSMNIMAAQRGAAIRRLIIVRPEDEKPSLQPILETQIAAMEEVRDSGAQGSYEVRLWFVDSEGVEVGASDHPHFGLLMSGEDVVAAYPEYRHDDSIGEVRLRAGERTVGSLSSTFFGYWNSEQAMRLRHCPTLAEIQAKAYEYCCDRGYAHGREREDFFRARRSLITGE